MRLMVRVDQFAHAVGVLAINRFALGFAHLLKNDLLGGLRGNTAQRVAWLGKTQNGADFRFGIGTLRFGECHFDSGIGDGLDDGLHCEEFQRSRAVVEIDFVILIGPEMLARGQQHGVLDGVQNDLGVDALLLAEQFN